MKILIEAHHLKIPAKSYGGTERVIYGLGKELSKLGHEVAFLVKKGSQCDFAKIYEFDASQTLEKQLPLGYDMVHFNGVIDGFENIKHKIFTIHGNVGGGLLNKNVVFISKNHASRCGSDVFVYNGLDWSEYPTPNLNLKRDGYHFLGKAKWKVKNFSDAVSISLLLKQRLLVMGGVKWQWWNLKKNMLQKIHPRIKYLGMVDNSIKMKVIERSKGLVFPVRWHEPFGLAIIESMYAGAPVFGSCYGSLPELITKKVGVVAKSKRELIEKMRNANFSPIDCHQYAKGYFSSEVMAENYLTIYKRVLDLGELHSMNPTLINELDNDLMPF